MKKQWVIKQFGEGRQPPTFTVDQSDGEGNVHPTVGYMDAGEVMARMAIDLGVVGEHGPVYVDLPGVRAFAAKSREEQNEIIRKAAEEAVADYQPGGCCYPDNLAPAE